MFGCGGNRDRVKRSRMGTVASELADIVIVTTDNPRHEQPDHIIADILQGIPGGHAEVVPDRREAIRHAASLARSGDTVLIAGKGHETYQESDGRVIPFDDVGVAMETMVTLGYQTGSV